MGWEKQEPWVPAQTQDRRWQSSEPGPQPIYNGLLGTSITALQAQRGRQARALPGLLISNPVKVKKIKNKKIKASQNSEFSGPEASHVQPDHPKIPAAPGKAQPLLRPPIHTGQQPSSSAFILCPKPPDVLEGSPGVRPCCRYHCLLRRCPRPLAGLQAHGQGEAPEW